MRLGKSIRKDFPLLNRRLGGRRLVYLDSAATAQRPACVIEAMEEFYLHKNASPRRGLHALAAQADEVYEKSRETVARHIGAKPEQIVFVRNTTEALNLLSYSLERALASGSKSAQRRPLALTRLEHHSNLVPWQQLAARSRRPLAFVPFDLDAPIAARHLAAFDRASKSAPRPALLSITHASNVLGTINDARALAAHAHEEWGCPLILDAAQSVPHLPVDVKRLGCDFLAFSGHKALGPFGVGVLYMADDWMERLPPFLTGGGQIGKVSDTASTWASGPSKFEAGTPDAAGAVGLAEAVRYTRRIGIDSIRSHERALTRRLLDSLSEIDGLTLHGPPAAQRLGVASFTLQGIHAHDVGTLLDREGVAVRVGHHCAQPLMRLLGVPATARASLHLYNDRDDVDALVAALHKVQKLFS